MPPRILETGTLRTKKDIGDYVLAPGGNARDEAFEALERLQNTEPGTAENAEAIKATNATAKKLAEKNRIRRRALKRLPK